MNANRNSLSRRIMSQGRRRPDLRAVPAGSAMPGPAVAAGSHLVIMPGVGAGLSPLGSLVTSDGAMIPATGPGQWDQLIAAGRIR